MNEIESILIIGTILFLGICIPIYCACITNNNNNSETLNLINTNNEF